MSARTCFVGEQLVDVADAALDLFDLGRRVQIWIDTENARLPFDMRWIELEGRWRVQQAARLAWRS